VHAASSTASVSHERPSAAAALVDAFDSPASGIDPLSGVLSPKRMRAEQQAGSAYSPDLSRALKSVVKVHRSLGFWRQRAAVVARRLSRRLLVALNTRQHATRYTAVANLAYPPTHRSNAQIFTTSAQPNFSAPWQMQAQTKCTASGFAVSPLESRRILTNAHAVANQVGAGARWPHMLLRSVRMHSAGLHAARMRSHGTQFECRAPNTPSPSPPHHPTSPNPPTNPTTCMHACMHPGDGQGPQAWFRHQVFRQGPGCRPRGEGLSLTLGFDLGDDLWGSCAARLPAACTFRCVAFCLTVLFAACPSSSHLNPMHPSNTLSPP
jgi:hypothetical protein